MAKKPTQAMFADSPLEEEEAVEETGSQFDDIPVSSNFIDLPSKGLLGYPSSVTHRDILVKDEEILSSCTKDTLTRTMNSALKGILNNWEHFEKLSIHDRDYIIIWIWANTYSAKKYVEVTCQSSKCKHTENKEIDLLKVPVIDINPKIKVPLEIPMDDGKVLKVRPNTVKDEMVVEEYLATKTDPSVSDFERLMMIASIDLEMNISFPRKIAWVTENVSAKVFGYVRKYHQYFSFGAKNTVEHVCPKCGEVTIVDVPFQVTDILFPQLPDDFEKLL